MPGASELGIVCCYTINSSLCSMLSWKKILHRPLQELRKVRGLGS